MIRAVFALAVGLGVSVALPQGGTVKERKELMKGNADQAKIGAAMAKGEQPFDLGKAQKIFATFEKYGREGAGLVCREIG